MKILHVVDSLNPGGMENGVVNVANQLAGKGVRTHIACLVERGSFADRLPDPSEVTVLEKGGGLSLAVGRRLANLVGRLQPHVIHTHNLGPLVYAAIARMAGARAPILHGEHGQIQAPDRTPRRVMMRRLLYRCCHSVHTVSEGLKSTLLQEGFRPKRMRAIVNGVDCERYHPPADKVAAKAELNLPADGVVLGIVGRFVALKRHQLLLDSLRTAMVKFPRVHLVVAGDHGPERDTIVKAMQEHPHAGNIHWLGMVADMRLCYQALDLLVVPSEIEGLSNAVLEAMASGVPVLAHSACGNAEAIVHNENGFLYDISDATALSEALREVLTSEGLLRQAAICARQRAESHFSMESMAQGYLRLYAEVAGLAAPAAVSGGG